MAGTTGHCTGSAAFEDLNTYTHKKHTHKHTHTHSHDIEKKKQEVFRIKR